MPEFWMDSNSLITPYRGSYPFDRVPQFWDFLKLKAEEGVVGSPELVLEKELTSPPSDDPDDLELWAKLLKGSLFLPVDGPIQLKYNQVVQHVQTSGRYKQHWIAKFLDGADPWLVAYAMALGGRIVTFEKPEPRAKRPKIPDIAQHFNVRCLTLWDMLNELKFRA